MNTRRHTTSTRSRTTVTTLGELIAAAYDAADGHGRQRSARAARLVSDTLARHGRRQLRFIR